VHPDRLGLGALRGQAFAAMSWGQQAQISQNPFAPVQPMQAPLGGGVGGTAALGPEGEEAATGPRLGPGSELRRLYSMPANTCHRSAINCMCMVDDQVYTADRDNNLCMWRGEQSPAVGFQLTEAASPIKLTSSVNSMLYEPSSKWLFCGLWRGEIQAFCKDPVLDDRLTGHRRSVNSIAVHSSVVVSGSADGTVRLWTISPQAGRFQCHGQPLNNPTGPVNSVRVFSEGLWVGAEQGVTCFDLNTLQPRGTIPSQHAVVGMLEFQGYMLVAFKNGDVRIFDGTGGESYCHPSRGEHTTNTAVELMMHPVTQKPLLLCGQDFGFVTAYDLPDFRPRGSFVAKSQSHIRSLLDVKADGMFLTGGQHGDVMMWQWAGAGAVAGGPAGPASAAIASSPFAPHGGVPVASPFAAGGFSGGVPAAAPAGPGDLMMG